MRYLCSVRLMRPFLGLHHGGPFLGGLFLGGLFLGFLASGASSRADGPSDNISENVRPIPPKGIELPSEKRSAIEVELAKLKSLVAELSESKDQKIQELLPDVEIFYRAVRLALDEDGFFEPADFDRALELIEQGIARGEGLRQSNAFWLGWEFKVSATVRGFRSKIDGSVQPYGVVFHPQTVAMPEDGVLTNKLSGRADVWCRGRSEKGLELQFLATRLKNLDPAPSPGTIMIHPFGRYCNANKLAGEVDTLEALEHAMKSYPIDPERVAIRGFSMGGAAAWHLAVHYPDKWFAATPGAGFSETPDFLKVFQSEELKPYWFEKKLWQYYDCPVWVRNLINLPTIAYSGEIDKQKQAADIMAKASWDLPPHERFELLHIVAPKTAHSVSPEARTEIERRLKMLDEHRPVTTPDQLVFTTATLRYNKLHWLTVDALREHWVPATIYAGRRGSQVSILPDSNIAEFTLDMGMNELSDTADVIEVSIEGEAKRDFSIRRRSDRSWGATFQLLDGKWEIRSPIATPDAELKKRHLLQGPIDDAFMAPFLFVRPTLDGMHPETQRWVEQEFEHAVREWHRQMRGDAKVKSSEEITAADLQKYHLVLWGDPKSNPTIAKVLESLPVAWNSERVSLGGRDHDAKNHVPVLIYPNPLAPDHYVVLNSGFTYREYDYLNNARQVPKLPDWAIIDVSTQPNARWPGRLVDADFFDERWQVKPTRPVLDK